MSLSRQLVSCYHCGSDQCRPYDEENGWTLVKCEECGLVYLNPRPGDGEITSASQTGQHRGDETIDVTGAFDDSKLPRYSSILADFFSGKEIHPSSWLDIGCGHGEFLIALKDHFGGTTAFRGCEPNSHKIASACSKGLEVSNVNLNEHHETYEMVSLLNVFSHLPDPKETLKDWSRLIQPGGYLFLETGHSCHLSPETHHKPYYLPDHLSFANREIVESLLRSLGFSIVETRIYRHTVFPEFSWKQAVKEVAKVFLRRPNRAGDYFPRFPDRDMYILAKLDRDRSD